MTTRLQRQTLNNTNKLNVAQFSMQKYACSSPMIPSKEKFILIYFSWPPTYCECDKYDSNTNVHKIISVTLWLELRTFHFKWEVNEVQILFVISLHPHLGTKDNHSWALFLKEMLVLLRKWLCSLRDVLLLHWTMVVLNKCMSSSRKCLWSSRRCLYKEMLVFLEEMLVLFKKTVVFLEKTQVLPGKWSFFEF